MYTRKAIWLNVAVYALTAVIAVFVVSRISENFEGAEKKLYMGAFLIGAFFFGKLANWLVLKIFGIDISK